MTSDGGRSVNGKPELLVLIKQSLEAGGAHVEISGTIEGASRKRHTFDLVATKNAKRVPIDVRLARTGRVELDDVLKTYAKSLDTDVRPAVMIAMPSASSDARKSAKTFGIVLIEGSGMDEVLSGLTSAMLQ